jgi:predicted ester cyclase
MSLESNKAVVRRFVAEYKNGHDSAVIDEVFAEHFVTHFRLPSVTSDLRGFRSVGSAVISAMPDITAVLEDLLADGDKVVERTTASGTHLHPLLGIPATNRKVSFTEIHIYRFEKGKIVEHWPEVDFYALFSQIGVIPAMPTRSSESAFKGPTRLH